MFTLTAIYESGATMSLCGSEEETGARFNAMCEATGVAFLLLVDQTGETVGNRFCAGAEFPTNSLAGPPDAKREAEAFTIATPRSWNSWAKRNQGHAARMLAHLQKEAGAVDYCLSTVSIGDAHLIGDASSLAPILDSLEVAGWTIDRDELTGIASGEHRATALAVASATRFHVGQRVRLVRDVERYDDGIAPAGETGTVSDTNPDCFFVQFDRAIDWLEKWDNQLQWIPRNGDDPSADLEAID